MTQARWREVGTGKSGEHVCKGHERAPHRDSRRGSANGAPGPPLRSSRACARQPEAGMRIGRATMDA